MSKASWVTEKGIVHVGIVLADQISQELNYDENLVFNEL